MNVARILFPVKVLGPGNRLGIWLVGCHRQCPGCSNPELWNQQKYYEIALEDLQAVITPILKREDINGVVITGGEPFNQSEELLQLLRYLEKYTEDILVYTGYMKDELCDKDVASTECLSHIGVLVDGPYVESLNDDSVMRGSSNQKIYILKEALNWKYKDYFSKKINEIQNFMTKDGVVSVGIHKPNFKELLMKKSQEKGVIIDE